MINIDAVIRLNQLSASQGGTICKQMKITATKKNKLPLSLRRKFYCGCCNQYLGIKPNQSNVKIIPVEV